MLRELPGRIFLLNFLRLANGRRTFYSRVSEEYRLPDGILPSVFRSEKVSGDVEE